MEMSIAQMEAIVKMLRKKYASDTPLREALAAEYAEVQSEIVAQDNTTESE